MKKFWTLNHVLAVIIFGTVGCFVIGHATPTLAIRTKMLFNGYFRSCLTARIVKSEKHGIDGENVYYVTPSPVKYSTAAADLAFHSILLPNRYEVTTFGLSFATMSTSMLKLK